MSSATKTDDRLETVSAVPQRIMQAWKDHDGVSFAEVFTEDGTMILPGVYQQGRAAIAAFMTAAFAGPYQGTQVVGTPFEVRFLTDDVAVLLTEGGVRPATASEVPESAKVRATWVLTRQDDTWLLASYSNSPKG